MKIRRLLFVLLVLPVLPACEDYEEMVNNPQPGDIYILEEAGIYYPMKIDSIAGEEIYMVNSKFVFADAVPGLADLPDDEFDYAFHLIYEKEELKRLYREEKMIRVYRPDDASNQ